MAPFSESFLDPPDYFYTEHPPVFRIPFSDVQHTRSSTSGSTLSGSRPLYSISSAISAPSLDKPRRPPNNRKPSRIFGTTDPHPSRLKRASNLREELPLNQRGSMTRGSFTPTIASSSGSSIRTTSSKFSTFTVASTFSNLRRRGECLAKRIPRPSLIRNDSIIQRPSKKQKTEKKYGTSASAMAAAAATNLSQALLIPRTKTTPNEPTVYHPISLLNASKRVHWRENYVAKVYTPIIPENPRPSPAPNPKKRNHPEELPKFTTPHFEEKDTPFVTRIKEIRAQMTPEERTHYTFTPSSPTTALTPSTGARRPSVASISTAHNSHVSRQSTSQQRLETLSASFERAEKKKAILEEHARLEAELQAAEKERERERKRPVPIGWRTLGLHERIVTSDDEIGPGDIIVGTSAVRYWEPESPKISPGSGDESDISMNLDNEGSRHDASQHSAGCCDELRSSTSTTAGIGSAISPTLPQRHSSNDTRSGSTSSDGSIMSMETAITTPGTEIELEELCVCFERLQLGAEKAGRGKKTDLPLVVSGEFDAGKEDPVEGKEKADIKAAARGLKILLEKVNASEWVAEGREEVWQIWAGVTKAALETLEKAR